MRKVLVAGVVAIGFAAGAHAQNAAAPYDAMMSQCLRYTPNTVDTSSCMEKVAGIAAEHGWCKDGGGWHHCLPYERRGALAGAANAGDVELPSADHPDANPAKGY